MQVMSKLSRFRGSRLWNGLVVAAGGAIGVLAAFMLSLEALWRALDPNYIPSCDVDSKLSCSEVAGAWQSALITLPGGHPVPNAFIGLPGFAVIVTIGVVMSCGWRAPAWFTWCFRAGVLVAFGFSTWLLEQSLFSIGAMCPWCLTMDAGMVVCMIGTVRLWAVDKPDDHATAWRWTVGLQSVLIEVLAAAVLALVVLFGYMTL